MLPWFSCYLYFPIVTCIFKLRSLWWYFCCFMSSHFSSFIGHVYNVQERLGFSNVEMLFSFVTLVFEVSVSIHSLSLRVGYYLKQQSNHYSGVNLLHR